MNIFCKKVFLFVSLIGLAVLGAVLVTNNMVGNNSYYKLSPGVKYLFVGSSFVSCGVMEKEVLGSVNFSMAGESYFYSYPKIKKIIEANPQLKYIFLDYSNFKLTNIIDHYMWTDMYLTTQYLRYNALFEKEDEYAILKGNPLGFLSVQPKVIKENILFLTKDKLFYPSYVYWGGYDYFNFSKTDSLIQNNHHKKPTHEDIFGVGHVNLEYLLKIKEVCLNNNVNLILFRTPAHHLDPYRANEEFFQSFKNENLSDLIFLDFHNFPLENKEFLDLDHLNSSGATKFSVFLNKLIQDSLWIVADKQKYIDREVEHLKIGV